MSSVVLDCQIFDLLADDDPARHCLAELVGAEELEIVVPETLHRELLASPFGGVPDWCPATIIADRVFVLDHSRLDFARPGEGETFSAHRGASNKTSDAVLADIAHEDADLFVSEDKRARQRYGAIAGEERALDYATFRTQVLKL